MKAGYGIAVLMGFVGFYLIFAGNKEEKHAREVVFDLNEGSENKQVREFLQRYGPIRAQTQSCRYTGLLQTIPELKGTLNSTSRTLNFSVPCFGHFNMSISYVSPNSLSVRLNTGSAYDYLCFETLALVIFGQIHTDIIFLSGEHVYTFRPLTPKQLGSFDVFGLKVYLVCGEITDLVYGGFNLVSLFGNLLQGNQWGKRPDAAAEAAVIDLFHTYMNYDLLPRKQVLPALNITEDIHSGDLLGLMDMEGGAFIMYASGSRLSHIAMAIWMEDSKATKQLYVVESYVNGIQKSLYNQWISSANKYNLCVVLMPLKGKYRRGFNETAAIAYIGSMLGSPYGWFNFLFGWLDTPKGNIAPPLDMEQLLLAFYVMEQVEPNKSRILLGEGLNKRLGSRGLDLMDLISLAKTQGKTIYEVIAEPEQDEWLYNGHYSLVCSAFAAMIYKKAGVLPFPYLQATEMLPRDLYSLDLFDQNPSYLPICQRNNLNLTYCQLTGKYTINLGKEYSSIPPGKQLFQTCPSEPPLYSRPQTC